jgi:hypothetical protein
MWHLYMAAAEKSLPARPFLTPAEPPVYKPWVHTSYGYFAYVAPSTPVAPAAPKKLAPLSPLETAILATH